MHLKKELLISCHIFHHLMFYVPAVRTQTAIIYGKQKQLIEYFQ